MATETVQVPGVGDHVRVEFDGRVVGVYSSGALQILVAGHDTPWAAPEEACHVVTPPGTQRPDPDEEPLSDDDPRYRCISCRRIVDPDLEPSAGEPLRCSDCHVDSLRDGRS